MYADRDDQLSQLLRTSIESLDISRQEYLLAVSRYEAVGQFLASYWDDPLTGGAIYPQGSMLLGTVTRNYPPQRRDRHRPRRPPGPGEDLDHPGRAEGRHRSRARPVRQDRARGAPGARRRASGAGPCSTRGSTSTCCPPCPTTRTAGPASSSPTPRSGPGSSPTRSATPTGSTRSCGRSWWKSAASVDVSEVPDWALKTTLQRTVQALKRHRDIYFAGDLGERPAFGDPHHAGGPRLPRRRVAV